MRHLFVIAALIIAAMPAHAQRKDCEALKSEIDAKVRKNGVRAFTLDIVSNDAAKDVKDGQIVGSCDGGTRKIVFRRP